MVNIPDLRNKAEGGNASAQAILGLCYLYGYGAARNYEEAFRLLSLAKKKGVSRAIVGLGKMFAEGLGVPRDLPMAKKYYEAAAKVEIRAQLELARICAGVNGGETNSEAARFWYGLIADMEEGVTDSDAAAILGALTFDEIDEAKCYLEGESET